MIEIVLKEKETSSGIYCYKTLKTGIVVYIGKDTNLKKQTRHKSHLTKNKLKAQWWDQVLQKNPNLYVYEELLYCDRFWLSALEKTLIQIFSPKYNIIGNDTYRKKVRPKEK